MSPSLWSRRPTNLLLRKRFLIGTLIAALLLPAVAMGCAGSTGDLMVYVEGPDGLLGGAKVVSTSQPEGQLKVTGITVESGLVTFQGIKTGKYEFAVSRFGYEPKEVSIDVRAGRPQALTVTLARASS